MTVATERGVLETVTGTSTLEEIGRTLDRMWSVHDHVPESVRTQVAIAVGEIGANIIEHAHSLRAVRLCMDVHVMPTEVRIEFLDDGQPCDVDVTAMQMPDEMAERGRGIALAKAVLALLEYRRGEVNHWTLVSKPFG